MHQLRLKLHSDSAVMLANLMSGTAVHVDTDTIYVPLFHTELWDTAASSDAVIKMLNAQDIASGVVTSLAPQYCDTTNTSAMLISMQSPDMFELHNGCVNAFNRPDSLHGALFSPFAVFMEYAPPGKSRQKVTLRSLSNCLYGKVLHFGEAEVVEVPTPLNFSRYLHERSMRGV